MGKTRFFDGWGPERKHIARAKGELMDLRRDIEGALEKIGEEIAGSVPTVEITGPASGTGSATVTVKVLDAPGGDLVDTEVILAIGAFQETEADSGLPGEVAAFAVIDSVSKGALLDGDDMATANIQTDSDGEAQVVVKSPFPEKVVMACREAYGGPSLKCTDFHVLDITV